MNAFIPPGGENKLSQLILLMRLLLALPRKRNRYPLTCAALWSALRLIFSDIPGEGIENFLVITHAQVDRFLEYGWEYTEPRLQLLQQASKFPLNLDGARQLAAFRQQMEEVRDRPFEFVSSAIYEDPSYAIYQHIGQAFRNQVTGRMPFVLQTLADLPLGPSRVCDAGCGTGIVLGDVLERVPNAQGVGVDISHRLLKHAGRVLGAWGLGERARLIRADIRRLPANEGAFDFVLGTEVLEHLPDPAAGLQELKRALASGGWLVTSIPVREQSPLHLYVFDSIDEVRQMHLSVGLKIERQQIVEIAPGVSNVLSAVRKN